MASPLRVVSYNVRYFGHRTRGLASTRRAMRLIAEALARLDPLPHLVCLQEVETTSLRSTLAHRIRRPGETQLERLMEMLDLALAQQKKRDDYQAYYFPAHAYRVSARRPFYTTGLAILARGDLVVDRHNARAPVDITHRRNHPVARLKQTRICAHVRFATRAGRTLDVFNTHLSLPTTISRAFWTGARRLGWGPNQLEEARNLVRFVASERASDCFLVAGDFNALPGSPVYRYLVEEAGYQDALARVHRLDESALCAWPTAGFMRMRMHLDHLFGGSGVRWLDADGTTRFGDREGAFHGLSDHVPLVVRCRLAP